MIAILLPAIPVLVASALYGEEVERLSGNYPAASVIGMILGALYLLLATISLLLYYLAHCIPWKLRHVIGWIFAVVGILITFLALAYIAQAAFWLLLGSLIKPEQILPFASGMF